MNTGLIIFIIAQVFGLISWLLLIYSYTKEDIDKLVFIQILVCIFDFISYLLLGADAGLLICLIELVKSIFYYKSNKDNLIFIVSLVLYMLVGLFTIKHWFAILPVIGSIIDSYGTSKNAKTANICSIISNTLWTAYDILILSYIGAFNDVIVVICNILILIRGYSRLMKISKFRIIKINFLTKKNVDAIYELDKKNYGIKNTWNKEYQMDVYKKNKDSFYFIIYKHELVGYINYLNITLEEYEKLKRKRIYPDYLDVKEIIPFKANKKSYILIESINIKESYQKEEAISLINKKINNFIKIKKRQRIYIHGILAIGLTEFQKKIYEESNFVKIKEYEDGIVLYELPYEMISKI